MNTEELLQKTGRVLRLEFETGDDIVLTRPKGEPLSCAPLQEMVQRFLEQQKWEGTFAKRRRPKAKVKAKGEGEDMVIAFNGQLKVYIRKEDLCSLKREAKEKETGREKVEVEHHSPFHVYNENQKEIEKAARIGKDPTTAYQPVKETRQPDCFHYKKDQYQRGSFCDYWHHGGRSPFLCTHSAAGDEKKKWNYQHCSEH